MKELMVMVRHSDSDDAYRLGVIDTSGKMHKEDNVSPKRWKRIVDNVEHLVELGNLNLKKQEDRDALQYAMRGWFMFLATPK
jgi:Fe-S cluster biosynthesis and repair protein YggX